MPAAPLRDSLPEHAIVPGGATIAEWPTLLVVDGDPHMLRTLTCYFEKHGFHVAAAATLSEAKSYFQRRRVWTMVIADCHLPDGTGWEFQGWVRERAGDNIPPFLMMSGGIHAAVSCGEMDILAKPFRIEELQARVQALLRLRHN